MPPRPPIAHQHRIERCPVWVPFVLIPAAIALLVWTVGNWQTSYLAQIEARKVEANTVAEVVAQ